MNRQREARCVFYTCVSDRDNPYDPHAQPKEHATWHNAYWVVRLESNRQREDGVNGIALNEKAAAAPEQCQFVLVWRPIFHPFRLRVNDVVRVDGDRLGRVIRVTECAAVVLVNPPMRAFKTRLDRQVRFQPSAVTVRISADSEMEVLILLGIQRHQAGDWGDVGEHDRQENELSLQQGFRLLSVYHAANGTKFWIITESDRQVTTVLLPEDY